MKTHGKIKEKTRKDPNEIIIIEAHAEIIIYDKYENEKCRAIIDLDDVEKIKAYRWSEYHGYVFNSKIGRLHNYIMNFNPKENNNMIIDHKDRNRLNCKKENLHITTYQINGINKGKQSNNTTGYPGVSWDKSRSKWEAHIKLNQKKKFLGYFEKLEDAIKARQNGELKYFGQIINRENDKHTVFKKKTS